jgi:hypothetical protein
MALLFLRSIAHATSLAMFDNYPLTRRNSRFDLHILRGHLWGVRFLLSVIGERQVTDGNGRNLRPYVRVKSNPEILSPPNGYFSRT